MPERESATTCQESEETKTHPKRSPALGLCLGACAITIARQNGGDITFGRMVHDGKVAEVLRGILSTSLTAKVVITGRGFRNMVAIPTISEPESVELAYGSLRHAHPDIDCIVSAGGETFIAYALDQYGKIRSVQTGNKCASGTGEFFLQQIKRMGLSLEEAMTTAVDVEPYQVASRCSVFCKSDCTHAMNKGLSKGRIVAGLCRMMAEKIATLVKKVRASRVLITGGVNEIVAHATAAVFFDPKVETIFEIGGQDAKYTFITNRVASDYAMNEACSAGTGSFLEEACLESLGIGTRDMESVALRATSPPDFNDQCAAFIGSDIKTAIQEGVGKEDIVAGLVYSVCRNYLNRVKGARSLGQKIFMQGGVCYNRTVPAAMATLCGREIIVPPEPGLMGAFGVALEVLRGVQAGRLEKKSYRLDELAERTVISREPFVCKGDGQGCDRKCTIARIEVNGVIFPFGGACDRYYNMLRKTAVKKPGLDLVRLREDLVFSKYAPPPQAGAGPSVGIPAALLTNTLYPFYATFFSALGMHVVLGTEPSAAGMDARGSSFCYPVLLSHGFTHGLLLRDVDYIFLPQVKSLAVENSATVNCTCPFVQADPYYLRATFHDTLGPKCLTEVLEFDRPNAMRLTFRSLATRLGFSSSAADRAFTQARQVFDAMRNEMFETGRKFLRDLDPDEIAIVLFGRPYNAFSRFGNMGIPHKFASRGYRVIPHDFLPLGALGVKSQPGMYWATGQGILQVASFVARTTNLFGVFVTNFSYGPDSIHYWLFPGHHGAEAFPDPGIRRAYRRCRNRYPHRGLSRCHQGLPGLAAATGAG